MIKTFTFLRSATSDVPAGITVSKKPDLPEGDFVIDEYSWGPVVLWFVADDDFTSEERQAVYRACLPLIDANPSLYMPYKEINQ